MQFSIFLLAAAGTASAYTIVEQDAFMHKNVDSIVQPGQYKSHLHTFFGSDAVTANTNSSKELQAGCTTAHNANDLSSYWIPTLLFVKGTTYTPVPIYRFSAYYVGIESAEIAIPQNYKVVAGNSKATKQSEVNALNEIEWWCEGDAGETKDKAQFPSKTCSTHLQALLLFHDCVNPTTLESAFSGTQNWSGTFKPANRCPAGMKRMPKLRFSIRYDLRKVAPSGWTSNSALQLTCGKGYCFHGDFINGWLPEAATNMLKANDKRVFAEVTGPLGGNTAKKVCASPKDKEPTKGTSDYVTSVKLTAKRSWLGRLDRRIVLEG